MRLVLLTGMSGAGKTQLLRFLEDWGYFCVDNLPPKLIEPFVQLCQTSEDMDKVAIVVDIRSGHLFDVSAVLTTLESLNEQQKPGVELVYMDCAVDVLIARYKETRRNHPLAKDSSLESAILREQQLLSPLKEAATYLLDTTQKSVRVLRQNAMQIFNEDPASAKMRIEVLSFGFKNGLPREADMVFDVRFLPNPFYIASLKEMSGQTAAVKDYVMDQPATRKFLQQILDMLTTLLPQFVQEGKTRLTIAIGCTGGMHRSVVLAEQIQALLSEHDYNARVRHRDMEKEMQRYTRPKGE